MDKNISVPMSLLVALIAILIVFGVLIIIILATGGLQKGMEAIDKKTKILPAPENKILDEDKDAVAAVLAATIDFNKETGKEPKVKSVTRIEE